MNGAREMYRTIRNAARRNLGGLELTHRGRNGGDSRGYRWGRVIFVTSTHARGKCINIYLVDDDETLFEVYGVVGGNPGWTEYYGWIRKGTWVVPILQYLRKLDREYAELILREEEQARALQSEVNRKIGEKVAKFNDLFLEGGSSDDR